MGRLGTGASGKSEDNSTGFSDEALLTRNSFNLGLCEMGSLKPKLIILFETKYSLCEMGRLGTGESKKSEDNSTGFSDEARATEALFQV